MPSSLQVEHHGVRGLNVTTRSPASEAVCHLLDVIRSYVLLAPTGKINSRIVTSLCDSLDVSPTQLWNYLKGDIFWSHPDSGLQIVLVRKGTLLDNCSADSLLSKIPLQILNVIRSEIKRHGANATVAKLIPALNWGRGSDNFKRFGPLRPILEKAPGILYDPSHVYSRKSLEDLAYFPDTSDSVTSDSAITELVSSIDMLWSLSESLATYAKSCEDQRIPLRTTTDAVVGYGLDESTVYRIEALFVPGNVIYLRKDAVLLEQPESGTIEEGIVYGLRQSAAFAIDYDTAFRLIKDTNLFGEMEIQVVQAALKHTCQTLSSTTETIDSVISKYCFYDPDNVYLRDAAKNHLAFAISEQSTQSTRQKEAQPASAREMHIQSLKEQLPAWCLVDAVVNTNDGQIDWWISKVNFNEVAELTIVNTVNGETKRVLPEEVHTRPVGIGDKVRVMSDTQAPGGSAYNVVGISPPHASLQLSKYEFRSFSLSNLVIVKN